MKLTNTQVEAIASEISSQNKRQIESEERINRNNKRVIADAKKIIGLFKKIPSDIVNHFGYRKEVSEKNVIHYLAGKLPVKTKELNWNDVKRTVIIESVDAENMNHLKQKLKSKF